MIIKIKFGDNLKLGISPEERLEIELFTDKEGITNARSFFLEKTEVEKLIRHLNYLVSYIK